MGRQDYLTRLALGRSALGDPLRNEDGSLFLGPHTHDNAAPGYVQQFDDRGHAINIDTDRTNRRLRRAQNEVLHLAGVVQRRSGETKTAREHEGEAIFQAGKETVRRIMLINDENSEGLKLQNMGLCLNLLSQWWLVSLRTKLFIYRSHITCSLLDSLRSTWVIGGPAAFLFAGLSLNITAKVVAATRYLILDSPPDERSVLITPRSGQNDGDDEDGGFKFRGVAVLRISRSLIKDVILYAIEGSVSGMSMLQSLFLMPSVAMPDVSTIVANSLPVVSPIILLLSGYACSRIRESLVTGLHGVFLNILPRPEVPTKTSAESNNHFYFQRNVYGQPYLDCGYLIGITSRYPDEPEIVNYRELWRRYRGPRTTLSALSHAFPGFFNLIGRSATIKNLIWPCIPADIENKLQATCSRFYAKLLQTHADRLALGKHERLHLTDESVRQEALLQGLRTYGIHAVTADIDIYGWTKSLSLDTHDDASTATPEALSLPDDLQIPSSEAPHIPDISSTDPMFTQIVSGNFDDDMLESNPDPFLLQPLPPLPRPQTITAEEAMAHVGQTDMTSLRAPTTEELQILFNSDTPATQTVDSGPVTIPMDIRTAHISQAISHALHNPPPLIRAPTELDGSVEETVNEIRSFSEPAVDLATYFPRSPDTNKYHVSVLSLLPINMIAMISSDMITSILMLPLDICYTRLLARTFVAMSGGSLVGGQSIGLGDLWPANPIRAMQEIGLAGNMRFMDKIVLTYALQGILSTMVWRGVSFVAAWRGRNVYGWGQF